jgi:uncharacterized membrane-anchored protein
MSTPPATALPVARLVGVVLVSFSLIGAAVFPQLSARLAGDQYQFRVSALDPVDPFRGAYVALAYPDLRGTADEQASIGSLDDDTRGDVFIPLTRDGEVWDGGEFTRTRPASGPYLACTDRNFEIDCGIDSWFLPQSAARAVEDAVRDGTAIATVRVDGRGNAALVDVAVARP